MKFKKLILPIVIILMFTGYLCIWLYFYFAMNDVPIYANIVGIVGTIIPISLVCLSVYYLVQKIKEIKKDEEDLW